MRGAIVDLSAFSARMDTARPLAEGELVVLELPPAPSAPGLRLTGIIWDVAARGAIVHFVNLGRASFLRLQRFVERSRQDPRRLAAAPRPS